MSDLRNTLMDIRVGNFNNDDLNLIIEAVKFKRAQNGRAAARTLVIGERVQFNSKNGVVTGRLEQIKIKKAIVVAGSIRWNVPLAMLESV